MEPVSHMAKHFIIIFDKFPISKQLITAGRNSPQVITACRFVNIGLFLSGNIRRDTSVSVSYQKQNEIYCITFPGNNLRRVSPDERSISFFLFKAKKALEEQATPFGKMDNGILLMHSNIEQIFEQLRVERVYVANDAYSPKQNYQVDKKGAFIYDMRIDSEKIFQSSIPIPRPPTPERFILDLNLYFDSRI